MKTKIPPRNLFIAIWFALQLLLFSMLGVAQFNFKLTGTILILIFAVVQMFLVLLFFMRLRLGGKLIWVFAAVGFFWLLIMFTLVASDYLTRQWH